MSLISSSRRIRKADSFSPTFRLHASSACSGDARLAGLGGDVHHDRFSLFIQMTKAHDHPPICRMERFVHAPPWRGFAATAARRLSSSREKSRGIYWSECRRA